MNLLFENIDLIKINEFKPELIEYEAVNDSAKLVIISREDYNVFEELMKKILTAISFHPCNLSIIETKNENRFPLNKLVEINKHNQILVFGVDPHRLCLPNHLNYNKSYKLENFTIQFTSSLKEMNSNQEAKKLFWAFAKNELLT